mmetsp:Transcript_13359/g.38000  ORF Transcript_13359/g.38000 Transcript_13359/m.38000 type:complete len:226 (-) Transcript_13359:264-941(-)
MVLPCEEGLPLVRIPALILVRPDTHELQATGQQALCLLMAAMGGTQGLVHQLVDGERAALRVGPDHTAQRFQGGSAQLPVGVHRIASEHAQPCRTVHVDGGRELRSDDRRTEGKVHELVRGVVLALAGLPASTNLHIVRVVRRADRPVELAHQKDGVCQVQWRVLYCRHHILALLHKVVELVVVRLARPHEAPNIDHLQRILRLSNVLIWHAVPDPGEAHQRGHE